MNPLTPLATALEQHADDQVRVRAVAVFGRKKLAGLTDPRAKAEIDRRDARPALHRAAEQAALAGVRLAGSLRAHPQAGMLAPPPQPA